MTFFSKFLFYIQIDEIDRLTFIVYFFIFSHNLNLHPLYFSTKKYVVRHPI